MVSWSTHDPPDDPDHVSPGGASEIRQLPGFPSGALAHATTAPGATSSAAFLTGITEFFYTLSGRGELWRRSGEIEETVDLLPGRCTTMPPEVVFQYRAGSEPLRFIVLTTPRWERERWHEAETGHWPHELSAEPAAPPSPPWETRDLRDKVDYLAPDRSEIRELTEVELGGLAHCTLPSGATSSAVRHGSVEEIWFVLSGEGELSRSGLDHEVVALHPGRGATIPREVAFQFRAIGTEPLRILIGTFPRWPGPREAQPAEPHWA